MAGERREGVEDDPEDRSEAVKPTSESDFFTTLPAEIIEAIGIEGIGNTAQENADWQQNLRLISQYANLAIRNSPTLRSVRKRVDDLRSMMRDHYEAVMQDGIPSVELDESPAPRGSAPVPASDHLTAVIPYLGLRSPQDNSALAKDILAVPNDGAEIQAMRASLPYFDRWAESDRSHLITDAIRIFGDRGMPVTKEIFDVFGAEGYPLDIDDRYRAADIIVEARSRGWLTEEHNSDILRMTKNWPDLEDILVETDQARSNSVETRVRVFGPNKAAALVLENKNSRSRMCDILTLTKRFEDIDPKTRSDLIHDAITIFGRVNVALQREGRAQAAAVIVEARAGEYLNEDHTTLLATITSNDRRSREFLDAKTRDHQKFAIHHASEAEIANLREIFETVEHLDVPLLDGNRLSAEHERMAVLTKIGTAIAKASSTLGRDFRSHDRDRGRPVR